jgi:hypothetical protein
MKRAKSSEESIQLKRKCSDEPSSVQENEISPKNISSIDSMEQSKPSIILQRVSLPVDIKDLSIDFKHETHTSL